MPDVRKFVLANRHGIIIIVSIIHGNRHAVNNTSIPSDNRIRVCAGIRDNHIMPCYGISRTKHYRSAFNVCPLAKIHIQAVYTIAPQLCRKRIIVNSSRINCLLMPNIRKYTIRQINCVCIQEWHALHKVHRIDNAVTAVGVAKRIAVQTCLRQGHAMPCIRFIRAANGHGILLCRHIRDVHCQSKDAVAAE